MKTEFLTGLSVVFLAASALAAPVAYYRMQDDAAGKDATLFKSAINSPELDAAASTEGTPPILKFSNDVPGKVIVSGEETVNADNRASLSIRSRAVSPALYIPLTDRLKNDDFTVEFFLKLKEAHSWAEIFAMPRSNNAFTCLIQLQGDTGAARARIDSNPADAPNKTGFNQGFGGTAAIKDGQWHHIALTYDGLTRKATLYVDYKPAGTATTPLQPVYDGVRIALFKAATGLIDELRISDAPLTPEQFLKVRQ